MNSHPDEQNVFVPSDLDEAVCKLSEPGSKWVPLAGGTDLMVGLDATKAQYGRFLALWKLAELRGIDFGEEGLSIGASVTYSELRANPIVMRMYPMVATAAAATGAIAIQNRGTIGGNIANASPAADTPPALLAYGAQIKLTSKQGSRLVAYDSFHTGYKKTILRSDELITRIVLPRRDGQWHCHYRKVGTRSAQAIAKVVFAGALKTNSSQIVEKIRLCYGSVGPTVLRAGKSEFEILGKSIAEVNPDRIVSILSEDLAPIDDIRSTAAYRLKVAGNILREFLIKAGSKPV
jgi:CO/xanthine dehydrogenase FAD-binding subunit